MKRDSNNYFICDWCGLPCECGPQKPFEETQEGEWSKTFEAMCAIKCSDCCAADDAATLCKDENERDIKTKLYASMAEVMHDKIGN